MNNYVKTYRSDIKRRKLPLWVKTIYVMTLITAVLHAMTVFFEGFAEFVNKYISSPLRFAVVNLTDVIPFSLAELLVISLPVILIILISFAIKNYSDSGRSVMVFGGILLSVVMLFYILFFFMHGVGYNTKTLDKKLGLEKDTVDAEELYETTILLADEANRAATDISFRKRDFSYMPYSYDVLSDKLNNDYADFSAKNDFIPSLRSQLKPVILSPLMSYTHVTGIYSYFTGETNINTDFPDYTIPFTAAHEMAHQRGIAREDEANFIAFLVCKDSTDPYIKYSAYVNMLDYFLNALYGTDEELYKLALRSINGNIIYEFVSYGDFFEKYHDSEASKITGAINDTYLKLNGTEGERSYGLVVDLTVAYYKAER